MSCRNALSAGDNFPYVAARQERTGGGETFLHEAGSGAKAAVNSSFLDDQDLNGVAYIFRPGWRSDGWHDTLCSIHFDRAK